MAGVDDLPYDEVYETTQYYREIGFDHEGLPTPKEWPANYERKAELMRELARDTRLPPTAKIVAWALIDRARSWDALCYLSHEKISSKTGLNRKTVILAIHALENAGWLRHQRRGQNSPNHYFIDFTRRCPEEFDFARGRRKRHNRGGDNGTLRGGRKGTSHVAKTGHIEEDKRGIEQEGGLHGGQFAAAHSATPEIWQIRDRLNMLRVASGTHAIVKHLKPFADKASSVNTRTVQAALETGVMDQEVKLACIRCLTQKT